MHLSAIDAIDVENEFQERLQGWLCIRANILVPDDVNGDLRVKPEVMEVRYNNFYESMGTNWGDVLVCGISYFVHDGDIYVATSGNLKENMTEITTSEYSQAKDQAGSKTS